MSGGLITMRKSHLPKAVDYVTCSAKAEDLWQSMCAERLKLWSEQRNGHCMSTYLPQASARVRSNRYRDQHECG